MSLNVQPGTNRQLNVTTCANPQMMQQKSGEFVPMETVSRDQDTGFAPKRAKTEKFSFVKVRRKYFTKSQTTIDQIVKFIELSIEFSPAKITIFCTPTSTNNQQREAANGLKLTHGC